MQNYYTVTECMPNVYRIFSREQVYMDLLVGEKAALLFDTGFGFGNLKDVVKKNNGTASFCSKFPWTFRSHIWKLSV